jgi:RNA polymerase sigma factor (sigma-70 family)
MRQRFDTDDVLQSAVISVYEHLDRFRYRGEGSLDSWMHAIIDRRLKSRLRQHGALKRDVGNETALASRGTGPDQCLADDDGELSLVDQRDLMATAVTQLTELEERDLNLVQGHFFDGRSVRSIAHEWEQPEATLRRRLAMVLLRLQRAMVPPDEH